MAFSSKVLGKALALSIVSATFASGAGAQEVTLVGRDSPLNITGTLLSSSGGRFVVQTAIGEFEIEQSLVTCEGEACPQSREIEYDLNLVGSGEIAEELVPILAEGFAATLDAETVLLDANGNPLEAEAVGAELRAGAKVDVQVVDFDGEEIANLGVLEAEGIEAYEKMVSGEAPIVFSSVRATRRERDLVSEGGAGDLRSYEQDHVIAVAGFAVVVNPKNALGAVTLQQVAEVFAGRITDWSDLGGQPGPITLYSYDSESETFDSINELLLEPFDYTLSSEANIVRNSSELTTAITEDESGFGIVDFHSRRGTRPLPLTNSCGMTFYVSPFNIKTEEYPLGHRVHAYNRPDIEGYARDFIDYIDGPDLDGLVSKAGFVDLSIVSEVQVDAAERVAIVAAETTDTYERGFMDTLMQRQNQYERLSTTFRFAPGSNEMDAKARRDTGRLIEYLALNRPSEILFVGFTDDKGTFDANLLVSEQRAAGVMERILSDAGDVLDGTQLSAAGYGELSPTACNTTPRGRAINRRVEVWVR